MSAADPAFFRKRVVFEVHTLTFFPGLRTALIERNPVRPGIADGIEQNAPCLCVIIYPAIGKTRCADPIQELPYRRLPSHNANSDVRSLNPLSQLDVPDSRLRIQWAPTFLKPRVPG
jgi:hypothetical protein